MCERLLKLAEKGELLHIPVKNTLAVELETSPGALRNKSKIKGSPTSDSSQDDSILNPKLSKHIQHPVNNGIHGKGRLGKSHKNRS